MKCLECGKNFVLLGNHIRQKHGIDLDDYRRGHNIPLTHALADDSLREHLSRQAKIRMLTDEGVEHIRRMQSLCDRQKQSGVKRDLPEVSTRHCHANNSRKATWFRDLKLPLVMPDWLAGMSNRDISIKHTVATVTLKKWVVGGHLPRRKLVYKVS